MIAQQGSIKFLQSTVPVQPPAPSSNTTSVSRLESSDIHSGRGLSPDGEDKLISPSMAGVGSRGKVCSAGTLCGLSSLDTADTNPADSPGNSDVPARTNLRLVEDERWAPVARARLVKHTPLCSVDGEAALGFGECN